MKGYGLLIYIVLVVALLAAVICWMDHDRSETCCLVVWESDDGRKGNYAFARKPTTVDELIVVKDVLREYMGLETNAPLVILDIIDIGSD